MSNVEAHDGFDLLDRIARFSDLRPLEIQQDKSFSQEALDIVYSRRLLSVVGREDGQSTAITKSAPIRGAGGITMTFAICPPGQGPEIHTHKATYETFTVLEGEFEFRWGNGGERSARLGRFDVISVPPGIGRAFRNVGAVDGVLQVVISGGVHDASDLEMPRRVTAVLSKASPQLLQTLEKAGATFLR